MHPQTKRLGKLQSFTICSSDAGVNTIERVPAVDTTYVFVTRQINLVLFGLGVGIIPQPNRMRAWMEQNCPKQPARDEFEMHHDLKHHRIMQGMFGHPTVATPSMHNFSCP